MGISNVLLRINQADIRAKVPYFQERFQAQSAATKIWSDAARHFHRISMRVLLAWSLEQMGHVRTIVPSAALNRLVTTSIGRKSTCSVQLVGCFVRGSACGRILEHGWWWSQIGLSRIYFRHFALVFSMLYRYRCFYIRGSPSHRTIGDA